MEEWYGAITQEIVRRLPAGPITLVVDTTKVGFSHRLLSIGVAFKKRTLPLVRSIRRGRKGHTKVDEQLALFKTVAKILPAETEIWVVGDTEFQSIRLLRWFGVVIGILSCASKAKTRSVGAGKAGSKSTP